MMTRAALRDGGIVHKSATFGTNERHSLDAVRVAGSRFRRVQSNRLVTAHEQRSQNQGEGLPQKSPCCRASYSRGCCGSVKPDSNFVGTANKVTRSVSEGEHSVGHQLLRLLSIRLCACCGLLNNASGSTIRRDLKRPPVGGVHLRIGKVSLSIWLLRKILCRSK